MSLNPRIGSQINYATIVALKVCVSTFGTSWDEVSVLVTSSITNSIDSI